MGEAKKTREAMKMRKWGSERIGLAQGTPAPGDKKEWKKRRRRRRRRGDEAW